MTALEIWNRCRDRLRRRTLVAELDDELRFHQAMLERDHAAHGESSESARRLGKMQLGNATCVAEETRAQWSFGWIDDLARDARYAMRTLARSPMFAVIALSCLALGIGANAAIFSVIDGVLLRPLPYHEPSRIVRLFESQPERGGDWEGSTSWPNFRDWRAQNTVFSAIAAYRDGSANLQAAGEPQRLHTVAATSDYFRVYGVPPLAGRTFAPDENESGSFRVVVISEALWRSRFGADPRVIGRAIALDDEPYSVIGVMPAAFSSTIDAWVPLVPAPSLVESRGDHFMQSAARLRDGVALEQAAAQMRQIAARIAERYPNEQASRSIAVESLPALSTRGVRPALLILFGAVALVLLIACANVANLLLARAAARQQEIAIRLALGASRARLVRQFLVESLILAIGGTILGALLARAVLGSLVTLASGSLPFPARIGLNGTVLVFLALVALVSGVAFGLAPLLQLTRAAARSQLTGAGKRTAGSAQQRLRGALVVGEIALSAVLLIGAVLLIRGFAMLLGTGAGFDPENVLTAHLSIPKSGYDPASLTPKLLAPIVERVRAIPGVESAGLISMLPIQDAWTNSNYYVPGDPPPKPGEEPLAELRVVSPGVYHALGVPLLAGRDFGPNDGLGGHVVLINQTLARNHFHDESPIGRTILLGGPGGPALTVIGVVGDVRQAGLDRAPLEEIDAPYTDTMTTGSLWDAVLVIRTRMPPAQVTAALREAVRSVAPSQPIYRVMTMHQVLDESLANRRLNLVLLVVFAGVALVLSAAGLYGVISYLVTQRRQEIGIRIALGARGSDVVRLMLRQGATLSAIGLAIGLLSAVALSRALRSLLYGVSNTDPMTYVVVSVLLGAVAIAATWIPASRAAHVDPTVAMRVE